MNKKIVLSILVVSIFIAAVGDLVASKKQSVPVVVVPPPVVFTTQPTAPPASQPPVAVTPPPEKQVICNISKEGISTSTWKTLDFGNITLQYPPNWKFDNDWPYPTLSGDGAQFYLKTLDAIGSGLVPTGAPEPYYCPRIVGGQHVDVGAYFGVINRDTLTRLLSIEHGGQSWGITFSTSPSIATATDPIFYTILETVRFKS